MAHLNEDDGIATAGSGSKTPAGIADGGVTPANIRQRATGDAQDDLVLEDPSHSGNNGGPSASGEGVGQTGGKPLASTPAKRTKVPITPQDRRSSRARPSREGHPGKRAAGPEDAPYLTGKGEDLHQKSEQKVHQPPGAVGLKNNLSQGEHKLPVHRRSLTEQGALLAAGPGKPSGDRPGATAAQKPEMYQNSFGML